MKIESFKDGILKIDGQTMSIAEAFKTYPKEVRGIYTFVNNAIREMERQDEILHVENIEKIRQIKGKVKDSLQGSMYELLKDTKGVEDARSVIISHLPLIDERIENVLKEEGYTAGYTLDYGYHYFPEKQFEGISYEEGEYESLLVTLGEGKGDNWWCVLFPPLCLIEAEESDTVEYKFFLQELMEKYL